MFNNICENLTFRNYYFMVENISFFLLQKLQYF